MEYMFYQFLDLFYNLLIMKPYSNVIRQRWSCIFTCNIVVLDIVNSCLFQMHNASQLADWCLHFISSNYSVFRRRPEMIKLDESEVKYINEHMWPPEAYMKYLDEDKSQGIKHSSRCEIM